MKMQGYHVAFKWLKHLTRISTDDSTERAEQEALNRAMAVLMLEIAQSDFSESAPETQTIEALLETYHSQEGFTADELLESARSEKEQSTGLYAYTRLACNELSIEARITLVEQFWKIAYADGVVDKYEEAAIRKASDLLYVPHSDFIKAKLSAAEGT
jgi:uncharacterized tellurite resistance protein B-like protein